MENSFDKLTLNSVPNQSIHSSTPTTSAATTVVASQFTDDSQLKDNRTNKVDREDDDRLNSPNVQSGGITEPLWNASTVPYRYPSNGLSAREQTMKLLSTSFSSTTLAENDKANIPVEEQNHGTRSLSTSLRIVVVGDIHEEWESLSDSKALEFLQPDLVLFTGDFGNENVEIVKSVALLNMPKAAILGNHDSWGTSKFSNKIKDGVQLQLESLGKQHVGYSNLDFPTFKLSVVGGRPFSLGGDKLFRQKLIKSRYGIRTMEESAEKIHKAAMATPKEHSIIFLSHNGPTGLGSNKDDICGKDWVSEGGDNGDPDLAQAISLTKETTDCPIPLVVFGHMHKEMNDGGFRKMMVNVNNTMYLNAAIVPRVKSLSPDYSLRAFTVVEFSSGKISKVVETWVSITGDTASLEEEHLLFSSHSEQT